MYRLTVTLFCVLTAAVAAGAPDPEADPSASWGTGWDKPVDPWGGCTFSAKGEKLVVSLPGGPQPAEKLGGLKTPRLLRDVEGDFTAQVRVSGNFLPRSTSGDRAAGLLLTDGKKLLRVELTAGKGGVGYSFLVPSERGYASSRPAGRPPMEKPAYLRIERRGNDFRMAFSPDGKEWTPIYAPGVEPGLVRVALPPKVKVGIVVETTADGAFRAEFDDFKLTFPEKK
jgi:regulation of enolase protein 1 (concanavalin A-like superfamily)